MRGNLKLLTSVHQACKLRKKRKSSVVHRQTMKLPSILYSVCSILLIAKPTMAEANVAEQIHLSLADSNGRSYYITWALPLSAKASAVVRKLPDGDPIHHEAEETKFLEEGTETGRVMFFQRVRLTDLEPDTKYKYQVVNNLSSSEFFQFSTLPDEKTEWSPQLAIYGDLGLCNSQSLPYLRKQVKAGMFDMILHVGDMAYDLDSNRGTTGDQWFRNIQDIATTIPYMTCPGNHEFFSNYSHYMNRVSMPEPFPGSPQTNFFYSFNVGPVHFVSYSTEYYYDGAAWYGKGIEQYNWMIKDLEEANKPESRSLRPWIITFGHKPMYCSNNDGDDCIKRECRVRVGYPEQKLPGLEKVWHDYKVDVAITAHEHSYERLFPIYNYTVVNGSAEYPYTNPGGPVHIITGSAGCASKHDPFGDQPPYSAFRTSDYGYTILKANKTHLEFSQTSDDKLGATVDHFVVTKDENQQWLTEEDYLRLNLPSEKPGEDYLWTRAEL